MSRLGENMPNEYSDEFDRLRQNRVNVSFYKYGSAKNNFGDGLVDAIGSMQRCVNKYKETGNTEYLCDAANYLMFEYMYPQRNGAYFKATDSGESAGIVGMSVKELENFDKQDRVLSEFANFITDRFEEKK